MASVKLRLNRNRQKKDGSYPISFEIIYKRKRKMLATGSFSLIDQWDDKINNIIPRKHVGGKMLQLELLKKLSKINELVLIAELEDLPPTDLWGRLKVSTLKPLTFFEFMQLRVDELTAAGKLGNARAYYYTKLNLENNVNDVMLTAVDYNYLNGYKLIKYAKGNGNNALHYYMRTIRATINEAIKRGLFDPDKYPFKLPGLMPPRDKTQKRNILKNEVAKLELAPLKEYSGKDIARDVWLMGFYFRGMDAVDLLQLTKQNVANGRVEYNRQKSGQFLTIKIIPKAQRIIEKYSSYKGPFLMPVLAVSFNDDIKNYKTRLARLNRNMVMLGQDLELKEKLTTKVTRHSWATIAKKMRIDRAIIVEALGHSSKTVTDIYLDDFDLATIDAANDKVTG